MGFRLSSHIDETVFLDVFSFLETVLFDFQSILPGK